MDISEFLSSMQSNPADRALSRAAHVSAAIPDADMDPSTQNINAMPEPDDSQSEGAIPTGGYDQAQMGGDGYSEAEQDDDTQMFEDGGEVEGEPEQEQPLPQPTMQDEPEPEVTGSVTPAIPDDAPAGDDEGAAPSVGAVKGQQKSADGDWLGAAKEGIKAAVDWGYNKVHAANRPVSDETHESSVRDLLSGHGAMKPDQWEAALQGVDPEGALDPATKQMKGLGELYKFYGEKDPAHAAAAVWSAIQHQRKQYDAYAGHASVALDRGNDPLAAKSAENAFNKVPDGILTKVMAAVGNQATLGLQPVRERMAENRGLDKLAGEAGIKDVGAPDGGVSTPDGNGRITQGAGGKFHVEQYDPTSKKLIFQGDLTKDQLKQGLVAGFDRALSRGTTATLQQAQQSQAAQRDPITGNVNSQAAWKDKLKDVQPAGGGPRGEQDAAALNGLPRGMNIQGLSVGEISRMRREYASGTVKAAPVQGAITERNNATISARERIAERQSQARENVAGTRESGLNQRGANAPGQQAANDRKAVSLAAADAKNEQFKTPQEKEDFLSKRTEFYRQRLGRPPGQQQAAPQQGEAPQKSAPAQPAPTLNRNGHTYTYDPARKGYVLQRQ